MKKSKILPSVLTIGLALGSIPLLNTNEVFANSSLEKLAGLDRYKTAVEVSKKGWVSSKQAIIVNSGSIVDALSVTPFAKLNDAPILLTDKNSLNVDTKQELERLGVEKVYIIGLSNSVSENVAKQLESIGIQTQRIGGNDRHETALNVAKNIKNMTNITEISVVNGYTGLADAVSIASVAASKGMVILPMPTEGTPVFNDFIKSNNIQKSYIIGSNNSISSGVENNLPSPERIGGLDRVETNTKVVQKFYAENQLKNVFVSKGGMLKQDQLIDALAVGVLASKENSPVLIVGNGLSSSQRALFKNKKVSSITQVGNGSNEVAFNELKELQSPSEPDNKTNIMYVTNTDKVRVRLEPIITSAQVGELSRDEAVEVVEVFNTGWVKIKFGSGTAYVSGSYLTPNKPGTESSTKLKYVKAQDGLNVREMPSTEDKVIGRLEYGAQVEMVEMFATGWVKIKYNGGYGYVSNDYLSVTPVK